MGDSGTRIKALDWFNVKEVDDYEDRYANDRGPAGVDPSHEDNEQDRQGSQTSI